MVERLFLAVPGGCLQFVIVAFPDHTHYFYVTQQGDKTALLSPPFGIGHTCAFLMFRTIPKPRDWLNNKQKEEESS